VRLQRIETTSAGRGLAAALVVMILGTAAIGLAIELEPPGHRTPFYLFGGAFIAIGLLLLYGAIHRKLSAKTPPTIVEAPDDTLRRGASVELLIRQPGPVRLASLRANLVGEERWITRPRHGRDRHVNWQSKHLGTFNFLEYGEAAIDTKPLEVFATLEVPREIAPSHPPRGDDRRTIAWKIEVWGVVRGRADFLHAFDVTVV
jgi:hypothetical protein